MKIIQLIEMLAQALRENPDNTEVMIGPTDKADLVLYNPEDSHDLNWDYLDIDYKGVRDYENNN